MQHPVKDGEHGPHKCMLWVVYVLYCQAIGREWRLWTNVWFWWMMLRVRSSPRNEGTEHRVEKAMSTCQAYVVEAGYKLAMNLG